MRVRVGSRASELARLQAAMVGQAILRANPSAKVGYITRDSAGDRDRSIALWQSADKGLFTRDLSALLTSGDVDMVVHSWKDLPIGQETDTTVAGTLERADPRDVLLVSEAAVQRRPARLRVLTSSPRRAWQLQRSLPPLLPWSIDLIETVPVRGNIPTRLRKLGQGEGDALVMAKAALDRLLAAEAEGPDDAAGIRALLAGIRFMVLPIREFPTAPAQGALAIEVAAGRQDMRSLVDTISHGPTWRTVGRERAVLGRHGGGCHEAIGVTVLERDYGTITSARGRLPDGAEFEEWSLAASTPMPPRTTPDALWPRRDERDGARRQPRKVTLPTGTDAWWVARADAVPDSERLEGAFVWAAGPRTWRRLAARGVWVHGSSEGLGDTEAPGLEWLAGRSLQWRRLTHGGSDAPDALVTYDVTVDLPNDLPERTHFFWTSGSAFREALSRFPSIRSGWHACGPGRTLGTLRRELGAAGNLSVWLDYDSWLEHVTE